MPQNTDTCFVLFFLRCWCYICSCLYKFVSILILLLEFHFLSSQLGLEVIHLSEDETPESGRSGGFAWMKIWINEIFSQSNPCSMEQYNKFLSVVYAKSYKEMSAYQQICRQETRFF